MIAAVRDRLIAEGRTHWFCIEITTAGRRFPHCVWRWARDENDAASMVEIGEGQSITDITEQHR